MGYRVYNVALDVGSDDLQLVVPIGQYMSEVAILTVPAGVSVGLSFGRGDPLPIDKPITFKPSGDDMAGQGLYIQNQTDHPGVSLAIVVVTTAAPTDGTLGARI